MTASNKALELQLQMKQNAEELQDFMRELESWEKDIKEVDSELRKQSGVPEENLPPIRNKTFKKKKKSKSKVPSKTTTEENKKNKIKSYDYEAWGKLDVDKILEELDKDDSAHDSVSPESDSEEDGIRIDAEKALAEKEKGNGYFKEGKYEAAIECYTRGIAADGTNALLPANRAMAYLKIQKENCNFLASQEASVSSIYNLKIKPLRRIPIEVVDDDMLNSDFPSTTSLVNNWKNSGRIETTENLDQDSQLSSVDIPKAKQLKIEEITDASSPQ
ncbi:UNVERIFIED_CONTAM: hypothetical protein H355_010713 [Colinus virginianus]|nr:hypothetical protein H355_010713 [Colinus virginianus]